MLARVSIGQNLNVRTAPRISDLGFQPFYQTRKLVAAALQRRDQQAELHRAVDYNTAKRVNFGIVHEPKSERRNRLSTICHAKRIDVLDRGRIPDHGAKTRKGQLLCFLCAFDDLVRQPTDEMLLLIQGLFHSFFGRGPSRSAGPPAQAGFQARLAVRLGLMGRARPGMRCRHNSIGFELKVLQGFR